MAQAKLQDQTIMKAKRINKETGELSASGELSVSVEMKTEKFEDSSGNIKLLLELREQLEELAIHMNSNRVPKRDTVSLKEQERHLSKVLPLYIKVFEGGGRFEKVDVKGLAALLSDTIVHNIHSRLAEQPAEKARSDVVQFFKKHDTDADFGTDVIPGWMQLKCLFLLTSSNSDIWACFNPEVPAALVKCLYLAVCLPEKAEDVDETFEEILTQIFLQLSGEPENVEKLIETQEILSLIIGLTSFWDQTSASWRQKASRILKVLSAHPTSNMVPRFLDKNCVRICIQNILHTSSDVSGPLLAEVAVAVFSFIRDTYHFGPALFIEFDSNDGYRALESILRRCEGGVSREHFCPVQELLDLIASFTLLGKSELKVAVFVTNPQPPTFKFDPPLTKGAAVKNLPAFHLLQASFLRSQDSLMCCQLLKTIHAIWSKDPVNFFLLEWTIQSLTHLAACLWSKPPPVQELFFSMLEMVIYNMNYIPHETLQAVLVVLKKNWFGTLSSGVTGTELGVIALKCFHKMTVQSSMLAEVLSDGGLLELMLGELRRRAKILRKAGPGASSKLNSLSEHTDRLLTTCMLEVVSALTLRSVKNTVSIRDLGMVPYIKIFLDEDHHRGPTLSILEQLAEINPDEFMSTAIGALCSSTQQELRLKQDLLQSLQRVLENPNSWDAFRKAGGFTGLLSLVTDMIGALSEPPKGEVWKTFGNQQLLDLLLLILHILALTVHLHIVNAHYFETGGFYEKLAEALLQLGCFSTEQCNIDYWDRNMCPSSKAAEKKQVFTHSFFQFVELADMLESNTAMLQPNLPVTLRACVKLLSYLDQFATGTYFPQDFKSEEDPLDEYDEEMEKQHGLASSERMHSGTSHVLPCSGPQSMEGSCKSSVTESVYRASCDQMILHPGAIRVVMTLLPHVFHPSDPQLSIDVQLSVANHVQEMVKCERNRQIMCEGGLVSTLLTHCESVLLTPDHPLHLSVTRILEKLSSQAITLPDFRKFLRLGNPLFCTQEESYTNSNGSSEVPDQTDPETETSTTDGSTVRKLKRSFSLLEPTTLPCSAFPPHQIVTLVSMTTPRTFRPHRLSSPPAFVEFDMSESGYGCFFLPSLAMVKGVTAESISSGGIGGDCRGFPPAAGLSFACWFQINTFSSACDSHPVRLLSIVRHMSRTEQPYICLSITFSAYNGSLVISSEEEAFTYLDMMEPEVSAPTSLPTSLRFRCSNILVPGQWHHLVVVMAKDVKKSCLTSVYVNGKGIGAGKMKYIQPFPGHYTSMEPTAVIDVYGLVGTPSLWKERAALVWRMGSFYLFEEALSSEGVIVLHKQGTAYQGNFLDLFQTGPDQSAESLPHRLVPEERISFGINTAVSTLTTVAQIRDHYNEVDCRLIAKEMAITSRDRSTPVLLAKNISQHLSGTARAIGAALIGRFGARTFVPRSPSNGFLFVGGPAVALSLVAMAPDDTSFYAAFKVLLSVLETNSVMQEEMTRVHGYKLLAFLLKMKSSLVSRRILQLVLCLSSSVEISCGSGSIQNIPAFQALLCDLEVWENTPERLDISVLNLFGEMLKSQSDDRNAGVMHSTGLLQRLLFELANPAVTIQKVMMISHVTSCLLQAQLKYTNINSLGLFLVYTLPPSTENQEKADCENLPSKAQTSGLASTLWIRNEILLKLCEILTSEAQQKTVFETLGSDWILLFLQPHLHSSTLKLGLSLLTQFLVNPSRQKSFREGVSLKFQGDAAQPSLTMDNLRGHPQSEEPLSGSCPGFKVLQELLLKQSHLPQTYEALASLMLRKTVNPSVEEKAFIQIDCLIDNPSQPFCDEAAILLLELVHVVITQNASSAPDSTDTKESWRNQFSENVMRFFQLLHNFRPRDPLWVTPSFLHGLVAAAFPVAESASEPNMTVEIANKSRLQQKRKPVLDFMDVLLTDNLLNVSASSSTHPVNILLEFSSDGRSQEQQQSYMSQLLELIMNIIQRLNNDKENDTQLSTQGCKNLRVDGQMGTLLENVVHFSKTVVQSLYDGTFTVKSQILLNFLADQIMATVEKGHINKEKTVSALYSSTNKALLHFLSQPRHSQNGKGSVFGALQTFMERWDVIMATYNSSVNFVTCLLHCLLLICSGSYSEGFGCVQQKGKALPCPENEPCLSAGCRNEKDEIDDDQLISLVKSCWSIIMSERQQNLEESFKIEISANHVPQKPVSMVDISPLWEEIAWKTWLLHTEYQKKKITKSLQKKFDVAPRHLALNKVQDSKRAQEFLSNLELQRARGHDAFEKMRKNDLQLRAAEWDSVSYQWLRVEAELLRERAVFGPGPGVLLSQEWVQGFTEGPNRIRLRIRRKELRRSKPVIGALFTALWSEDKNTADSDTDPKNIFKVATGEEAEEEPTCDRLTFFPTLTKTPSTSEGLDGPLTPEPCSSLRDCPDLRSILQTLRHGEEVKAKMCVVFVRGLSITEGLLLFGKENLLLCEGFTLSAAGDVCCRRHHASSVKDPYIANMLDKELPPASCKCWSYEDIKEARFMRFLLKDNAIELFIKNGQTAFLVFLNKDHVSAYKRMIRFVPALKGRAVAEVIANANLVAGQRRKQRSFTQAENVLSLCFRKTPVLDKVALSKWQKGEMSNFEYLMHLNTIAGRTYNDLMQYPVFPWVLADYHSETLDLSNPATFRDLSKPMGAQTETRKQMFIQRYDEVECEDDKGLMERCHYCTHYSSAINVASFLVRLEPFSHTFQTLQGGFDVPERMFYSVRKEWESASSDNMGDVRELIPEFFYLPDFLVNSNHIPLGCMEDGTALGDVRLPPWAKGDPREFIRVHREALESEYVTSHLHLWIDLIFGYRQQGPAAVESINTFHPYFYAQRDRQDNKDPTIKSVIFGYVSNFGQIPKQLFTKPHPQHSGTKRDGSSASSPTPFFFNLDKLKPSAQPFKELARGPVGQIICLEKETLVLEKKQLLLCPLRSCFFSWGFPDNSCAFGSYATRKNFAVCESLCHWGETLCAASPNSTTIITAGSNAVVCVWDVSIGKQKLTSMKLRQPLYGHTDAVTCLAASEVHSLIVSGSRDLTCILWDLEELRYITQLAGHTASISALAINDLTGEIVSCAGPSLYLWTMNGQLLTHTDTSSGPPADTLCVSFTQHHTWDAKNAIVTGCVDGIVRIWRTEYTRTQLPGPPEEPVPPGLDQTAGDVKDSCQANGWKRCLVLSHELGRDQNVLQRRYKTDPAITALAMSRSHATLLVGDAWGRVFTWTTNDL